MRQKKSVPPNCRGTANIEAKLVAPTLHRNANGEAPMMTQSFNLSRCQQKERKSVQTCKGQRVVKPSKRRRHMDVVHQLLELLVGLLNQIKAMGIHFQDEIIEDILCRLPVRSLLRFKCVSKFWKTLISEPYFKTKHQSHAMNDLNSKKFLVSQRCISEDGMYMYNFYCSPLSSVQSVEDVEKLDCPLNCKPFTCKMYGSCDGLVLLSIGEQLLLWNPSTRESIELPRSQHALKYSTCALGYDATTDDYKILKINHPKKEILALKSGSWREKVECSFGFDPVLDYVHCLAFVHGAFHWLGWNREFFVVSFSISDEVYGEIQLLEPMLKCSLFSFNRGISVLRGMLCFYSNHSPLEETIFKLWVMKDYGVKESWIQLYTIRDAGYYSIRPNYMFADGEVLLSCNCLIAPDFPFRTSKGPFGLWPVRNIVQEGIVYTESMKFPKSLI